MRLAVLGNGIAGVTAARHVRKLDPSAEITVVSDETVYPYARTALMYVYMGHLTFGHTRLYEDGFWGKNRIALRLGRVERVDPEARRLLLREGPPLAYDRLLIATGSSPRRGGWLGEDLQGVQPLYGLPDLNAMERDTAGLARAVVIGGGLIGIELAEMLRTRGVHVTMLVRERHYHASVLPEAEGRLVEREIRRHGVDLRLATGVRQLLGDDRGRVRAVVTESGEEIPAEFVGVGIGVRPNVGFLEGSGIQTRRGVLVDRMLRTNLPDHFAAGDCAELRDPIPGRLPTEPIWYTARLQGAAVAHTITGRPRPYSPGPFFNSAKFFTVEYQTYGRVLPEDVPGTGSFYWENSDRCRSVRLVYDLESLALLGVNLFGTRGRQGVFEGWITDGTPLPEVLANLPAADFDSELSAPLARDLVAAYNARHPERAVTLRARRGWRQWMSPDPRGLTGRDIPPGRALP
jgi:NADPH-dependent 2,4-dienoyl-CoA reductase/sulfur reductase-like enzyme